MNQQLLNVIVVDDELPLRQELRSFPWGKWGAALIGEAENGAEALQLCRDYVPDVVVTDITMPLMDGIELTRELRRQFPQVQVILLTCHSDFGYAREALRLGALEYLVKVTLEEEEMEQALHKAREAIERERAHRKNESEARRREQAKLLARLLKDKQTPDDKIVAALSAAGLLRELPTRVVLLKVEASEEDIAFVGQELQLALDQAASQAAPAFSWVPVGGTDYLLAFGEALPPAQLRLRLDPLIGDLTQTIGDNLPFLGGEVRLYAVVSESVASGTDFIKAFDHAKMWEEARFYEREPHPPVFVGRPVPLTPLGKAQAAELDELLRGLRLQAEALQTYMRDTFPRWCLKHRFQPGELKKAVAAGISLQSAAGSADQGAYAPLEQAETLNELTAAALRLLETQSGGRHRYRKEVRDAKLYIEQHLEEPITLHSLAEQVSLSPHYLSRLFREEVGESVNEYMTRLRIEKAIDMLQNTNLKVYEVAEKVGIPSYRYFSTMFRERTGLAPTDFKKQATGE
ncbi:response regulator transcription factor [Paenibacillus hamazuiensis]|uniref:response regulator transcription factor n=1 Tax=Paenibacillus hamazuiensis TaxID=2936508 RepID=UPI00200EF1F3|nr:response regulator [Paenibacillus hamazuiensis]